MREDILRQRCPTLQLVGPARLPDHRLVFTRRSKRWNAGAADVVRAQGFSVWGALYELHPQDREALDRQEGAGFAYQVEDVVVERPNLTRHTALTYTVIDKQEHELAPKREYVERMRSGAAAVGVPDRYLAFLDYLVAEQARAQADDFRRGLLIKPTTLRAEARGIGLVRAHPEDATDHRDGAFVAVVLHGRAVVGHLALHDTCERGVVELDQSLRHALGLPGREIHGVEVDLEPVTGRVPSLPLLRPRMLALPVWPPSWLDSEKQLAILHPNTIKLLGLEEGDAVRVTVTTPGDREGRTIRSLNRRVLPGSADEVHRRGDMCAYPAPGEIYLDLDARNQLGISDEGYPAWVTAHARRLVLRRIVVYGLTLFLALAGLSGPLGDIGASLGVTAAGTAVATLALAVLVTLAVVVFDLRSKVHY